MKKFYSTALAALCALGVSATINVGQVRTDLTIKELSKIELPGKTVDAQVVKENLSLSSEAVAKPLPNFCTAVATEKTALNKKIAPKKIASRAEAPDYASIEGEFTIAIGDYLWEESVGAFNDMATITLSDNVAVISCEYFPSNIGALYDENTGTLSFTTLNFGLVTLANGDYYVCMEPFAGIENSRPIIEDFNATYNPVNGKITFPANYGFIWTVYKDEDCTELAGYMDGFYVEGMRKLGSKDEAPDLTKIDGEYVAYFGDYYLNNSTNSTIERVATIEQDGDQVTISCSYFPVDVNAAFDSTTGLLTFSSAKLGKIPVGSTEYYVKFEPFVYSVGDDEKGVVTIENITGQYNTIDGSITFSENQGLRWIAYTDARYTTLAGYLRWFDFEGMERYVDPWAAIGKGEFTDNSLTALFGQEATINKVMIYQHKEDPALYKVEDPWKGLYAALEFTSVSPSIYLDATDPDNVLVPAAFTGINGGTTDGEYYIFNDAWFQDNLAKEPETPEAYTTLVEEDGMITVTFSPKSLLVMALTSNKIYYAGSRLASTLVFKAASDNTSGIDEVTIADENAPVEYYNLQGVRIDAPAAGQVVIKRQGSAVSKTLVR